MNKEELKKVVDEYDKLLPFPRYLKYLFSEYDINEGANFKICCPLHEEKTPSFSYSNKLDVWTCFGRCHTSGRTVKFHKLWLSKTQGNITTVRTLYDLYDRFSHILPNPDIFFKENKFSIKTINKNKSELNYNLYKIKESNKKYSVLKSNTNLNDAILKIFIEGRENSIKKDKDRKQK